MNWIIFGLVSFILQMYVLKHTYTITVKSTAEFDWEKAKKIGGISLWIVLIMIITSAIPIANVVELTIFWIIWLKYYLDPEEGTHYDNLYTYWRFKDKFFSRKI